MCFSIENKESYLRSVGKLYEFLEFSQEKQDLAERVMITRLHLYGKWIKVGSFFNLQTKPFRREVFYLLTYIHILDGCGCGCRYVIILKYTMKYLMRTWSWCERGWWKLSYGQLMIQILLSRRIHNMFLCQHFSLFFCLASFFTKKKKKTERNKQRKFSVIRYTHWQRGFVQHILEVMDTKFASKFSSVNHLFLIWLRLKDALLLCV